MTQPATSEAAARQFLLTRFPDAAITEVQYLDGGYSNDNFRVTTAAGAYVVRIPLEPKPAESTEMWALRAAEHLGLGATVIAHDQRTGALITAAIPGEAVGDLPSDRWPPPTLLADRIAVLHAQPPPENFPWSDPLETIRVWAQEAQYAGRRIPARLNEIVEACRPRERRVCHGDLNPWNVVFDGSQLHLVDWEWCCAGDPRFDLANLALLFDYLPQQLEELRVAWCTGTGLSLSAHEMLLWMEAVRVREFLWAERAIAGGNHRDEIVEQRDQRWAELGGAVQTIDRNPSG